MRVARVLSTDQGVLLRRTGRLVFDTRQDGQEVYTISRTF